MFTFPFVCKISCFPEVVWQFILVHRYSRTGARRGHFNIFDRAGEFYGVFPVWCFFCISQSLLYFPEKNKCSRCKSLFPGKWNWESYLGWHREVGNEVGEENSKLRWRFLSGCLNPSSSWILATRDAGKLFPSQTPCPEILKILDLVGSDISWSMLCLTWPFQLHERFHI